MKFTVSKTEIVKALSSTLGVVEKRQALPILSNVLLKAVSYTHLTLPTNREV